MSLQGTHNNMLWKIFLGLLLFHFLPLTAQQFVMCIIILLNLLIIWNIMVGRKTFILIFIFLEHISFYKVSLKVYIQFAMQIYFHALEHQLFHYLYLTV